MTKLRKLCSRVRGVMSVSVLIAGSVCASDYSFTGNLQRDDDHARFTFSLDQTAKVVIRTLSYGGGTNAEGNQISSGGFDPSVSIFDQNGALVATNQDGSCQVVRQDLQSMMCWDSYLNPSLPAGTYQVVLTQSVNAPRGPFLENGFSFDGGGNFTSSSQPTGFIDQVGNQRTSAYAVDISGVTSATTGIDKDFSSLVNAASFDAGSVAPNTILTFFGNGLGGGEPVVKLAGQSLNVLYSDDNQINIVAPMSFPSSTRRANLEIIQAGNVVASKEVNASAAAPALFTISQTGRGQVAVLNQDYSVNSIAAPAVRGSHIMIYGTGFGVANEVGTDGLSILRSGVTATIGGKPADVTFAGLAFGYTSGLQQINVKVPENIPAGSSIGVQLMVNGEFTQTGTTIVVE